MTVSISVKQQLLIAPLECCNSCNTAVETVKNSAMCDMAHARFKCLGTHVLHTGFRSYQESKTIIMKASD